MMVRNFTPFPVLKTERLILRQVRSSDADEIFALRSNEDVNKYLDRKPSQTMDEAADFIRIINGNIQRNDSIYWAITVGGIDKLVGTICLFDFSEVLSKAEIGFELLPDFQGKGIMREAISRVTSFGFQEVGISLIEAYTYFENQNSIKLLEKLNFRREGVVNENLIRFILKRNDREETTK